MDKIEVTPEMKSRIMANLEKSSRRRGAGYYLKRLTPVAACVALLLAAVMASHTPSLPEGPGRGEALVTAPGITEMASLDDLEKAAGFDMPDISASLPSTPVEASYIYYGDGLAEVQYASGDEEACFRKAPGAEDISGDYNTYESTEKVTVGGIEVTLKGDGEKVNLATWTLGDYTYSVMARGGLLADTMTAMVSVIR